MPKNRRAAALILALCLLTACSAPAPEPEETERAESEPLVEYIELGELVDAHYFASDGESCWYISDARNTGCTLWTFDLDTREADSVRFVFTDPETGLVPDTGDICGLCATENGLVVCVSWADSPHEEREFAFCLVGEDGSVEKLRRASELCPGATEFNHLGLNGRLYLYSDGAGITELSADLEPVRSVDPGVQGWCRLDADGGRLLLLQLGLDSWNYPVIENYYAIDPDTLKASPIESAAFRRSEYTLVEYGVDYGNIAGEATLPDGASRRSTAAVMRSRSVISSSFIPSGSRRTRARALRWAAMTSRAFRNRSTPSRASTARTTASASPCATTSTAWRWTGAILRAGRGCSGTSPRVRRRTSSWRTASRCASSRARGAHGPLELHRGRPGAGGCRVRRIHGAFAHRRRDVLPPGLHGVPSRRPRPTHGGGESRL